MTIHPKPEQIGIRIDTVITQECSQYSRSFLQKLFEQEAVQVNNSVITKAGYKIRPQDTITIEFKTEEPIAKITAPTNGQDITIIHQHEHFLIIQKPAGIASHPPHQNYKLITVSDWVVQHYQEIAHVGTIDRPGIVHRLDKETSGLMIVARTNYAYQALSDMFKNRQIHKEYLAIVHGQPSKEGSIDLYIHRHPTNRQKMLAYQAHVRPNTSRHALTHYQTLQQIDNDIALVLAKPVTGRTHQIRVHFTTIGHPLLGDTLYGTASKKIERHALHAHKLSFAFDGTEHVFESSLPSDMQTVIDQAMAASSSSKSKPTK